MKDVHNNQIGPQKSLSALYRGLGGVSAWCGLQMFTQVVAADMFYAPALGAHFHHVYWPWSVLGWLFDWGAMYPATFLRAFTGGLCGGVLLYLFLRLWVNDRGSAPYLHGSARWANEADLLRAGLLKAQSLVSGTDNVREGICLGLWKTASGKVRYLWHKSADHVLVLAPTRAGKGLSIILPTLLSWRDSALVLDPKGELHALTAGYRLRRGSRVFRFEPAVRNSARWNPVAEIRVGTEYETADAQELAQMLVDPDGKGIEGDHWRGTSMTLLVALLIHGILMATKRASVGEEATLAGVDSFLSDPTRRSAELWEEMLESPSGLVAGEARKMLNRDEREGASVLSSAQRVLAVYLDPTVAANTSRCDFRVRDLMQCEDPVTLYVTSPLDSKDRLRPLIRILLTTVIRVSAPRLEYEEGKPKTSYKHRLLMLLDEFPSLKRLPILEDALAVVAGYGITFMLVAQNRNQILKDDGGYGRQEAITDNTAIQVIMRPDKPETAEYVSKLCGETTVEHIQESWSGRGLAAKRSTTRQWIKRALLTPGECRTLPGIIKDGETALEGGQMLLTAPGMPVAKVQQNLYFQDPELLARAAVAAPEASVAMPDKGPKYD